MSDQETAPTARDDLRAAALERFATDGYTATSLQHIADAAGYAKSNVLYHFGTKEAVLDAAIGPAVEALEHLVDRLVDAEGAAEATIAAFVDFLFEYRLAVTIVVNQGSSLGGIPIIDRAADAIRRLAVGITADGGDPMRHLRFGVALAGATYALVAGATFIPDPIDEGEAPRAALVEILTELLRRDAG
ncbi:TetR/AcrR family transcriptional regulator [Agromyces archimandritae]|uniref:TetR/AcrR family transcriptional regulator n=1 Tax=Agromyces archimandritae TaxID=2781962 RepID=A0A975IN81_9MICO|nr:TetR/AcrR family transcriptional regulator [Agromyces archimandritae]QTX04342.1 TetR/AcrR family transcriptional regulator [Agromyces archimandritae]